MEFWKRNDAAFRGGENQQPVNGDPFEIMFFDNIPSISISPQKSPSLKPPSDPTPEPPTATIDYSTFGIMILHYAGPHPGLMKTVNFGSNSVKFKRFNTKSSTSVGHSMAEGGLGVGAVPYWKTPAYGKKRPRAEKFSSAGGTPILFDIN